MSNTDKLTKLNREIANEFPDFRVIKKADSRLMRVIDRVLRIITLGKMQTYMTGFITTMGTTVYVPANWDDLPEISRVIVLRHERVHMRQAQQYGRLIFSLLYLLAPLPLGLAWFRAKFEMEAYEESLAAMLEYYGADSLGPKSSTRNNTIRHFMSAEYFWMWPFRGYMDRWYTRTVERLTRDKKLA